MMNVINNAHYFNNIPQLPIFHSIEAYRRHLDAYGCTGEIPIFQDTEDFEEFATHYIWMITDGSLSLKNKEDVIHGQISKIFSGLAEVNQSSVDTQVKVKLAFFNHEVSVFNDIHLPPDQLADTFTRSDYTCSGTTSASAVFRYIDKELSRENPVVKNLRKNTPCFTFIIFTDAQVNDPANVRAEARKILDSNRFYKNYCRVLVVFLGREQDMATAVALANGDAGNVIALDDDLIPLLSPVIINSTVTFADGTHIQGAEEQDLCSLAKQTKEREQEGSISADQLRSDDLRQQLEDLLNLKKQMDQ